MISTKVFIISPHLMFGSGLESLLGQESLVNLVGRAKNVEQAVIPIQALKPDVVILDSDELSRNDLSSVIRILDLHPHGRIIGLSLHHNKAYTYQVNEVAVNGPADLLQIISAAPGLSAFLSKDETGTASQELPL